MGESSELFVNCLEAMVETCLPIEDSAGPHAGPPRTHNLSCSLSSLTLNSPTDKGELDQLTSDERYIHKIHDNYNLIKYNNKTINFGSNLLTQNLIYYILIKQSRQYGKVVFKIDSLSSFNCTKSHVCILLETDKIIDRIAFVA